MYKRQLFGNAIDLDLGCYYELRNGKKMLIDGLQFPHGRAVSYTHLDVYKRQDYTGGAAGMVEKVTGIIQEHLGDTATRCV